VYNNHVLVKKIKHFGLINSA